MSSLALVGFLLIIIGIVVLLLSFTTEGGKAKVAIGGFIDPIPFGFANDPQMLKVVFVIVIIMAIVFIVSMLRGIA